MITFDELKKWSAEPEQYESDEPVYGWIIFPDILIPTGTLPCWASTVTDITTRTFHLHTPPTHKEMMQAASVFAVMLMNVNGFDTRRMAVSVRANTGKIYFHTGKIGARANKRLLNGFRAGSTRASGTKSKNGLMHCNVCPRRRHGIWYGTWVKMIDRKECCCGMGAA